MLIKRIIAAIWMLNGMWGLVNTKFIFNIFIFTDDSHAMIKTCTVVAIELFIIIYNSVVFFGKSPSKLFSTEYVIGINILSSLVVGFICVSPHNIF